MCNFMLINFREDLQINLAPDRTLPKNPQASWNSIVSTDHSTRLTRCLGATAIPFTPK